MDRLVVSVDRFIAENSDFSCAGQIGHSSIRCKSITTYNLLKEDEFRIHAKNAQIHISHAGMGNILLAAELHKPIIILARLPELGEVVNNHQVDTLNAFSSKPFIFPVQHESEIGEAIYRAKEFSFKDSDWSKREQLCEAVGDYVRGCQ